MNVYYIIDKVGESYLYISYISIGIEFKKKKLTTNAGVGQRENRLRYKLAVASKLNREESYGTSESSME